MMKLIKVRSSVEGLNQMFRVVENVAEVPGANIFKERYRFTFMTYVLFMIIIVYFCCTVYTWYLAVIIQHDWALMLQSVAFIGTAIQAVVKFFNALLNRHNFNALRNEIEGLYAKYECENVKYQDVLTNSLLLVKRLFFSLLLLYVITLATIICVPLYFTHVRGQQLLILPMYLPGVDHTSHWGYTIHQVIHSVCSAFALCGCFASDTVLFLLVAQIPMMKNILKCKFDDLDEILQVHPRDNRKSGPLLKDIFQFHQQYIHFSSGTTQSFFWVIFVQMGTASASIICGILCQFLGVMVAGPVYLAYSFVVLYVFAGLGTLVEISNDAVTIDIYDSSWYLLTVPEQKMILIMLRESQRTEGMTIGGISPLSLNAALQITKTIYTVAMMLNEFFN